MGWFHHPRVVWEENKESTRALARLASPGRAGWGRGLGRRAREPDDDVRVEWSTKFDMCPCLDAASFYHFILLRNMWSRLGFVGEIETECTGVSLYIYRSAAASKRICNTRNRTHLGFASSSLLRRHRSLLYPEHREQIFGTSRLRDPAPGESK